MVELSFLLVWTLYYDSQRKPHRAFVPTRQEKEKKRKDAYSVEPELHDGCIVELIDFSAQGDQPVPALNFLFILFSGGLPVVSSQHCLQ